MNGDQELYQRVGSLEVKVATIQTKLHPIESWVEESKDFHNEFRDFKTALLTQQDIAQKEQAKRHRANSTKLNWLLVIVAIFTLIATVVGVIYTIEASHHAELDPAKIFHSFANDLQLSWAHKNPQDTGLPASYVPK